MTQFFPSSEQALLKAKMTRVTKYPWRTCTVGSSFAVDRKEIKFGSLVSLANKWGHKLDCRFVAVDHGEGPYEVANVGLKE